MKRLDRMRVERDDNISDETRYGSLFLVIDRKSHINDYGGTDIEDVELLDSITNCFPGSTCLFSNGDIYRLELTGWVKFGGDENG